MNYTISRNGQTYGPYTLDDLRRYVASGNVLPSDMAHAEGSTDWVPVSQLLSGSPAVSSGPGFSGPGYANPAYPQPYPAAGGALAGSQYPDAPNLHWGLVLLFSLLTCGLFMVIWNIIVTVWLRKVQPTSIALWLYLGVVVLGILNIGVAVPTALHQAALGPNAAAHWNPITSLVGLAIWITRLVARFSERSSLEQHYNGPEPLGMQLNPVMVFFFGGLYIQSQLNRINALKQATRMGAGRGY